MRNEQDTWHHPNYSCYDAFLVFLLVLLLRLCITRLLLIIVMIVMLSLLYLSISLSISLYLSLYLSISLSLSISLYLSGSTRSPSTAWPDLPSHLQTDGPPFPLLHAAVLQ